ncbi:hypothetical protein FQI52_24690, partial [Escherichia coli]|nr:hypothetical protein [Escherichia coli]
GKKSAQIREILISESTWEEMTCLFAPSLTTVCTQDPVGHIFLFIIIPIQFIIQCNQPYILPMQ